MKKKLLSGMLLGLLLLSACEKKHSSPEDVTHAEMVPVDQAVAPVIDPKVLESEAYQACKDVEAFGAMEGFPGITLHDVEINPDWTLREFLETPLADQVTSIESHKIVANEGDVLRERIEPSLEELKAGFYGSDAFLMGNGFTISFAMQNVTEEQEAAISVLDAPLTVLSMGSGFASNGITENSTNNDIIAAFGATTWNGSTYTYYFDDEKQSYISFTYDLDNEKLTDMSMVIGQKMERE